LIGKTVLDLEYLPYEDRIMYHNEDMNTIKSLSSLEKEQDMIFADNKMHTTLYSVNSYTKRDNSPGGLIGIFADITEMREKDKLIFEQAKLASMGEMIGNIAHQWRQPLSVITSIASGTNIRNEFGTLDLDILTKDMDLIISQAQYLSKTIDDFRSFTKINNIKTIFSISDALEQTISLVAPAIKSHHINLITDFNDDLVIEGYQNELIQAFVNIINNARDAVNEKVQDSNNKFIFIETKKVGLNFEVLIKDNGGGIPENVLHRIFEPYFTTKHKSIGTGIGLSMTYKILTDHHNSQIQVTNCSYEYDNQIYYGACFNITFKGKKEQLHIID
jgi:signal transduction histidine kinase